MNSRDAQASRQNAGDVVSGAPVELVHRCFLLPQGHGRQFVAIAGAPTSGKSIFAPQLAPTLSAGGRPVRVIPMDGFHLDHEIVYPEFDRVRDITVADASVIAAECDFEVAVAISAIS